MRLVAWTCPRCHRYLHGRLAAGGIDLRHPTLSPAVRAWAVTRGVSEAIAAALFVLDQPDAGAALRFQARRVGRLLVATGPDCERSRHVRWSAGGAHHRPALATALEPSTPPPFSPVHAMPPTTSTARRFDDG
jgi:hypothetical protein